jgi:hypothetical protein
MTEEKYDLRPPTDSTFEKFPRLAELILPAPIPELRDLPRVQKSGSSSPPSGPRVRPPWARATSAGVGWAEGEPGVRRGRVSLKRTLEDPWQCYFYDRRNPMRRQASGCCLVGRTDVIRSPADLTWELGMAEKRRLWIAVSGLAFWPRDPLYGKWSGRSPSLLNCVKTGADNIDICRCRSISL